jgi:SPP1 family predicted phage head-tail adaptor
MTIGVTTPTGRRTQQVRIEKPTRVADGQGGSTIPGYTLRAVVWAAEEPLSTQEALRAAQLTGVLLTAWTIPFRTDVSITDRVLAGRRVLQITGYSDPTQRRAELRILCSERQT